MSPHDALYGRATWALLESVGLPALRGLWNPDGPTTQACRHLDSRCSPLSSMEHLILRVAFDLWNGRGGARVVDLLRALDAERLALVMSLLLAANEGNEAVEKWIADRRVKP